jgi:excisionase family DNA binding protein
VSSAQDFESLWTVDDVARYFQRSKSWVYHKAADGTLPRLNLGGTLRFDPDDLRAWAKRQKPKG